jgi:hypothetical protein
MHDPNALVSIRSATATRGSQQFNVSDSGCQVLENKALEGTHFTLSREF